MKVLFNPFVSNQRVVSSVSKANQSNQTSQNRNPFMSFGNLQGPSHDVFEKSASQTSPIKPLQIYAAPAFMGRGPNGDTSAGMCLKVLHNITDPYSGAKMIPGYVMNRVELRLTKCRNIKERLNVLAPYEQCMQKREKKMYNIFRNYAKKNPYGSMQDCLGELKRNSLEKLQKDEFNVLNDIDNLSNGGGKETALRIRKLTKYARKQIKENKPDNPFKRKTLIKLMEKTVKDNENPMFKDTIMAKVNELPQSKTDVDAFVIKYANRGSHEIAARLLRPSVASIEHITPASTEGDCTLANFMTVSKDWNSVRGNTPFPEFIRQHPNIPKHTQEYTNDIIGAIQNRKLKGRDWYPFILKEKLYSESEGMIDVDISKYHAREENAFLNAPKEVKDIYAELKAKNAARRNPAPVSEVADAVSTAAADAPAA